MQYVRAIWRSFGKVKGHRQQSHTSETYTITYRNLIQSAFKRRVEEESRPVDTTGRVSQSEEISFLSLEVLCDPLDRCCNVLPSRWELGIVGVDKSVVDYYRCEATRCEEVASVGVDQISGDGEILVSGNKTATMCPKDHRGVG